MRFLDNLAASLVALSMLAAPAMAQPLSGAEKLRRLDMMLMVTSLRCRTTPDDFQADYRNFTSDQSAYLQKANADLRRQFAGQAGDREANRALDRISTDMANQYGTGHPWMNCAQLGKATRELAGGKDEASLLAGADRFLGAAPPATLAAAVP